MSKILHVSKSKYRAVISEMLPYERPVFFTNRFFARLLKFYGIRTKDDSLVATRHEEESGLKEFLLILGGQNGALRTCFQYNISKDGHEDGRCLSVIHPFHQVKMVEFYDKYKMLLIDFCQRSHFSVRYPYKVADFQKKQKGYHKLYSDDAEPIDTHESLKHFFAYKQYKNINFFYGDYRFLRAEKKFRKMTKLDLEHCFENISPELLADAMFGHDVDECPGTMAFEFCQLQKDFLNTKTGIVIGPEFSRIYAEIILQRIDLTIERQLEKNGIKRNVDYIFYRYVDDGFLFYNDSAVKVQFFHTYWDALSAYGLRIKKEKVIDFKERPFIETISVAKQQLLNLVDERFENRLRTFKGFVKMQDNHIDTPTRLDFKTFVNEVRNILGGENKTIKYKDITSFLLGIMQTRTVRLLEEFNLLYAQYTVSSEKGCISETGVRIKVRYEREFIDFCMNLIELLFYFLGCDMRMSTSVKTVSIINKLQLFVRGNYQVSEYSMSGKFPKHYVERLDDKISDEIATLFQNIVPKSSNMMETLNILEVEKVMLRRNQISPKALNNLWAKVEDKTHALNFFTVFEMIHFIKDSNGYAELKGELYQWIDKEIVSLTDSKKNDTESVLTFLETMCCPWIDEYKKREYATLLFEEASDKVYAFSQKQKNLFIQWHGYNVNEAILQINSEEVY